MTIHHMAVGALCLLAFPLEIRAESAAQSDWSGIGGAAGPETGWSSDYWAGESVSTVSIAGQLALSSYFLDPPSMVPVCDPCWQAISVSTGDIDHDGDIDVVAPYSNDQLSWFENMGGSGVIWQEHPIATIPLAIMCRVADLDDDGWNDIVASCVLSSILWFRNVDGSGLVWTEQELVGPYATRSVLPLDIDSDGDLDVLTTKEEIPDSISLGLFRNLGGAPPVWGWEIAANWSQEGQMDAALFDIDSDGDVDAVMAMFDAANPPSYPGQIWWCENLDGDGEEWVSHLIDPSWERAVGVFASDIDGDGDGDAGAASISRDQVAWWENTGFTVEWPSHQIVSVLHPVEGGSADFDGDGDEDVFVTSHDGTVVCENTEGSGLDWQLHPFSDGGSCRAYCSDIDLDGDLDLAVASTYPTHRLAWWRVTGFLQSGWLESSILDTGCDPQWASIDWTAIEPAGTDMSIQYRSSDDPGDLGAWSDPIQTPCYLSGLLDRHFQYRVNLMTTDPAVSPILYDITLNWDPTGIEGPGRPETLTVSPCPASDHVLIEIPGGVQGRILVVDVAGRVVSTFEAGGTESPYTWDAGGMPAGVYTVLFDSSEWSSTARVVVIH